MQILVQQALPDRRFLRVIEVQPSYPVVFASPIITISSPLFSCRQEKSHQERAKADFYKNLWVQILPVG